MPCLFSIPRNDQKIVTLKGLHCAFFTGSNTSCRTHIHFHYDVYKERCEVENIKINARCIPCDIWQKMQAPSGGVQSMLDNVLQVSKGPKEFSSKALLHSLTQLVTCDDQVSEIGRLKGQKTHILLKAFALVSKAVFRNCLVVMRPKTRTKEFLGPYDIETHLQNEYIKFMDQIKQAIQVSAIYLITR